MRMRKVFLFLFVFIVVIGTSLFANKVFRGEVYKINKYAKQVICRGPDLSMIDVGQKLYISDENNKLIATVEITRYYTTIIETKLISGNINKIRVKMPVYTSKKQFAKQKIKKIKYEKDYDYYLWNVEVIYEVEGEEYKKKITMILPKIIELRAKGSDESVKISADEIKYLGVSDMMFSSIRLNDGTKAELEEINIDFPGYKIPEEEWSKKVNRLVKKKIRISKEDVIRMEPIGAKQGIELEKEGISLDDFIKMEKLQGNWEEYMNFKNSDYSFHSYIDALNNGIHSIDEYDEYKEYLERKRKKGLNRLQEAENGISRMQTWKTINWTLCTLSGGISIYALLDSNSKYNTASSKYSEYQNAGTVDDATRLHREIEDNLNKGDTMRLVMHISGGASLFFWILTIYENSIQRGYIKQKKKIKSQLNLLTEISITPTRVSVSLLKYRF